jgi:hypothetical protein
VLFDLGIVLAESFDDGMNRRRSAPAARRYVGTRQLGVDGLSAGLEFVLVDH